jgi:hypothetical protein
MAKRLSRKQRHRLRCRMPRMEERDQNEIMRHVPEISFFRRKVADEYGKRLMILADSVAARRGSEEAAAAEKKVRAALLWLCRIGDLLSHRSPSRRNENDLRRSIDQTISFVLAELDHASEEMFRRRIPYHHYNRSEGEQVYAAFCGAARLLEEAAALLTGVDPDLADRLAGGAAVALPTGALIAS